MDRREAPILYGKLAGGFGETSTFSDHALWEQEGKIAGRYLAAPNWSPKGLV